MHDIQSDAGKATATGIGLFVSIIMLAGSAYMNALFAYRLGRTPTDGMVYAIMGVALDVFLVLMPFFWMSAIRAREWFSGVFMLLLWVVLVGVSANAAVGHISGSRIDAMSSKMAAATSYQDNRKELKRLEDRLEWLPKPTEAEGSLRAKIKSQQSQLPWQQTAECANQWNTPQKQFCAKFTELTSALNNVIEYDKTVARIAEIKSKTDAAGANHVAVIAEGVDAQATMYGKFFGSDAATMSTIISTLFAGVILMVASMGPYIALTPQRAAARARAKAVQDAIPAPPAPDPPPSLSLTTEDMRLIDITPPAAPVRALPVLPSPRDLSADAREILRTIGTPSKPTQVRPRDDKDIVGVKFYAWLVANNLTGEFSQQQIDDYYVAYTLADYRQGWDVQRAVKPGLKDLGDKFVEQELRFATEAEIEEGSPKRPTVWHVNKVPHVRLMALLRKYGIEPPDDSVPDAPAAPEPPNAAFAASAAAQEPAQTQPKNVFSLFGVRKATGE